MFPAVNLLDRNLDTVGGKTSLLLNSLTCGASVPCFTQAMAVMMREVNFSLGYLGVDADGRASSASMMWLSDGGGFGDAGDEESGTTGNSSFKRVNVYSATCSRYYGFRRIFLIASKDLFGKKRGDALFMNLTLPATIKSASLLARSCPSSSIRLSLTST